MRDHPRMRTTLNLDEDVVLAARALADSQHRSLGSVVSELVRRGLSLPRVDLGGALPVIRVPAGTAPITPEMVRLALDEH